MDTAQTAFDENQTHKSFDVCVVGLGYVGLPLAVVLASEGYCVAGFDTNPRVVESVHAGVAPFTEPGLDAALATAVSTKRLSAYSEPKAAHTYVIAVPTPVRKHQAADLTSLSSAVSEIAQLIRPGDLVLIESTSPPGTAEQTAELLAKQRPDLTLPSRGQLASDVAVAYSPERVIPGRTMEELQGNDRIVGGVNAASARQAAEWYRGFCSGEVIETDSRSAELVKLSENAFRDVNLAFAHELADLATQIGVNVEHVIELANRHPRVNVLKPGIGVGGHCIPIDPWFLIALHPEHTRLMGTARQVNDAVPHKVARQIEHVLRKRGCGRLVCLGASYKADTDDTRESPALKVIDILVNRNIDVMVHDPHATALELPSSRAAHAEFVADLDRGLDDADCVAVLVDHAAYARIDPKRLANKEVIDFRGILRRQPGTEGAAVDVAAGWT